MVKCICTIFTDSHLPQALALWESVQTHTSEWKFLALRIGNGELGANVPDKFVESCVDLSAMPNVHPGACFWYEPFEFCNYVRGLLHDYIWGREDIEEWWYVDADCVFVDNPSRLTAQWQKNSILLCPHRLLPVAGKGVGDVLSLLYGTYNSGLLGLRRSPEVRLFIDWFRNRLTWLAFAEPSVGMFVDQKWLDLVPSYFSCDLIRDAGVNVGYWNYSHDHACGNIPLTLLHFSQVDVNGECPVLRTLELVNAEAAAGLLNLAEDYQKCIKRWMSIVGSTSAYPFQSFKDGSPISKIARRAYYCDVLAGIAPNDPFVASSRYGNLDSQGTMRRFIDSICPTAKWVGHPVFSIPPSSADVLGRFSVDEIVNTIPLGKLLPAVRHRLMCRLRGLLQRA